MDLILWRHADAEASSPDISRKLTSAGRKQAARVAHWLNPVLPQNFKVISSPAVRTQETASALGVPFTLSDALGVGSSAKEILRVAGWPDGKGAVVIVGHQPTLGQVAALLLCGEEADWGMKKGSLWWFRNKLRNHEMQTVLRAVINPEII